MRTTQLERKELNRVLGEDDVTTKQRTAERQLMCGVLNSLDGLCQLIRNHCAHVYPSDSAHPFDVHGILCPHSTVRLGNHKWSKFCLEHKPYDESAEEAEIEDVRLKIIDRSRAARAGGKLLTDAACQKVDTIWAVVENSAPHVRTFLVSWKDLDSSDCTREPECNLINTQAYKKWISEHEVSEAPSQVGATVGRAGHRDGEGGSGASGPIPPVVGTSLLTSEEPVICPPCNRKTSNQLTLEIDSKPLGELVCTAKDFSKGPDVASGKKKVKSMMVASQPADPKERETEAEDTPEGSS
mmetsp:Transcript_7309/g.18598  ORF Transcript_7309/g.18598 Transcript_7309/m.18598 type:complete len:298 (-) Transcript_7309:902-1795(-)